MSAPDRSSTTMRSSKRSTAQWSVAFIVPVVLGLASCTAPSERQPPPPERRSTISVAVPSAPSTLDPTRGFAPEGAAKLFDGLLEHRSDGELDPVLAATLPTQDSTGKVWTVKLRPGVTFSDHTALSAADVVATYQRAMKNLSTRFSAVRSVKAVDDATVRFTLARKDPAFSQQLTLGIASAKSLAKKANPPIGTGPYTVTAQQKGKSLTLTARKDHFRAVPKVDTITVQFVPSESARLELAKAGKVDVAAVAPKSTADAFEAVRLRTAGYLAISMPADNPVTADQSMRNALNRAVDRDKLLSSGLDGAGVKAYTPITDAVPEFVDQKATFRHDAASAKKLLADGGWTSDGAGTLIKNGVPAELTLHYPAGDSVAKAAATGFATQVKPLGVRVTVAQGTAPAGDPSVVVRGQPFDPDPGTLAAPTATLAKALKTARTSTELSKRAVNYRAFDRSYVAAPTMVVLARLDRTYLIGDRWRGYPQNVLDPATAGFTWGLLFDAQNWTT